MFKKIVLSLMIISSIYAQNWESSFFRSGGSDTEQNKKFLNEEIFKKGVAYLTDEEKKFKIKRNFADPEVKNAPADIKTLTVPDYVNAYSMFLKSAKENKNTIAAYEALSILNTKFPQKAEERKDYLQLAKILYEKEKSMCKSYLYYGMVFERGIYHKVDVKQAILIFNEAIEKKVCKNIEEQVLIGKIIALQNKLKTQIGKK